MNKNYYLLKYKWGPGGIGFVILTQDEKSEVLVGKGHINKKNDLELKVEESKIVSISEDYTFKKIDEERAEAMKRKEEKYKNIT